jgi:hypothetical protein
VRYVRRALQSVLLFVALAPGPGAAQSDTNAVASTSIRVGRHCSRSAGSRRRQVGAAASRLGMSRSSPP